MRIGLVLSCCLAFASQGFAEQFTVTIRTSTKPNSGTDANAFIILNSGNKQSGKIPLTGGVFNDGGRDVFDIEADNVQSPITSVQLGHDNTGRAPGWHIRDVKVFSPTSGLTQTFPINGWISGDNPHGTKIEEDVEDRRERNDDDDDDDVVNSLVEDLKETQDQVEQVEHKLTEGLNNIREDMQKQIDGVKSELKEDMDSLREDVEASLKQELSTLIDNAKVELRQELSTLIENAKVELKQGGGGGSSENMFFFEAFSPAYNGNVYYLTKNGDISDRSEAESLCESHGGLLAEVDDEAEFDFIARFLDRQNKVTRVIISGSDERQEGHYIFPRTGEEAFIKWERNQPANDGRHQKNCLGILGSSTSVQPWGMFNTECFDNHVTQNDDRVLCEIPQS